MHSSKRAKTLTETVGAKHTPQELKHIRESATAQGLTVSGWARRAHLEALKTCSDTRLILSELLGLRRLFVALQLDFAHGNDPSEATLRAAIDEAERRKFAMADKRIAAYRELAEQASPTPIEERNS